MRRNFQKQGLIVLLLMGSAPLGGVLARSAMAASTRTQVKLPETYQHWLDQEVTYLITSDERALFLKLTTDAQRDQFITTFWQVRNPDPTSADNTVREEHYRRLAYANDHFGHAGQGDGWDTDQGMAYITLGAPKQRKKLENTRELKPIEIWFYENSNPVLPPYFYLMFFKKSPIEDYKLYSPYIDRPQQLVNSLNAINDDKSAIKLIQRDVDDEAAHVALSLIPGEPVDLKNPTPTLESDAMLNKIKNFRNLPQNRELLGAKRAAQESVSHRVLIGADTSVLTAMATRDSSSSGSIHYLLNLAHAGDLVLTRQENGDEAYSLELQIEIANQGGKPVYKSVQHLADTLHADVAGSLRLQRFAVEGRIPIEPGSYKLTTTLRNLTTQQAFTQSRSVLVPAFNTGLGLSQIVIASTEAPQRANAALLPFTFQGVRLTPLGGQNLAIAQGSPLRIVMQLWKPAGDPKQAKGSVQIHYLIGRLEDPSRQEEDQEVPLNSFDANGNLLLGKDLPTKDLLPGVYRLIVRVSDAQSKATAYQSMNFEVAQPSDVTALWMVTAPSSSREVAQQRK